MNSETDNPGLLDMRFLQNAALMALAVVFGLQLLRVLFANLVFYLRESVGASPYVPGVYALLLFLAAFLALPLARLLGVRGSLAAAAGGLGAARLAEQLAPWPAADLALTTVGVLAFLWFVPVYSTVLRSRYPSGGQALAMGLLLGIAIDTAVKGAFSTLEPSWQPGFAPALLMVFLAGAFAVLTCLVLADNTPRQETREGGLGWVSLAALGPVLFLELLLFQNVGQQTVLIGWDQPQVFLWIMFGNALGLLAAAAVLSRPVNGGRIALAGLAGLFVLVVVEEMSGIQAALAAVFGSVAVAMAVAAGGAALSRGVGSARTSGPDPGLRVRGPVVAWGLGALALLLMTFWYYANYGLDLPGGAAVIPPIAVAVLIACAVAALSALPRIRSSSTLGLPVVLAGLVLLVVSAGYWMSWSHPEASQRAAFPVRVMSYNIHQGFDQDGYLAIRDLVNVIEAEEPGIVALQEVSRGWVINGAFDMLLWLSRKLDMPYVWAPAADSVWGNAILSKYPIVESSVHPMPNNSGIPMDRSYATAVISLDDSTRLMVLATHLHHVEEDGHLRTPQVRALLDAWGGRERTVLMGDLNGQPLDTEIVLLEEAGLVDVFAASPEYDGAGYTFPARDPRRRIDYIWVSPDLRPTDFSLSGGSASDHLAVAVTLDE